MNAKSEGARQNWTAEEVAQSFKDAGLSIYDHFSKHGAFEGINPSNSFDVNAYFTAKAAQLNQTDADKSWTVDRVKDAFKAAGFDPISHYSAAGQGESLPVAPASNPVPADPRAAVKTFTLTTGVETVTGTDGNDTVIGTVSALTAENTLNTADQIDGLLGLDTAKFDLKSSFTGFSGAGKMTNVENIELTNSGTIARSFDATGVTGAQSYTLNTGDTSIALSNLAAAGITVNVNGQKTGDATIGFTAKAVEGAADALALGVNAVGTAAVKDEAGVVTTATKYVNATANGIENLTVVATGDNYVDLVGTASKTITVSGAGNVDIKAVGTVTGFDAFALKGKVTVDLTGAAAGTLEPLRVATVTTQ